MRLSYTYDVNTSTKEKIFDSILINNGVLNSEGSLYLDTPTESLYESILRFAGCAQKVCNMRYWGREPSAVLSTMICPNTLQPDWQLSTLHLTTRP